MSSILAQTPDLIFLDVQMPDLDGFEVLEAVGITRLPAVVFVTAFDEYALRAFDVHALDYLLKPITPEKFHSALHAPWKRSRPGVALCPTRVWSGSWKS